MISKLLCSRTDLTSAQYSLDFDSLLLGLVVRR